MKRTTIFLTKDQVAKLAVAAKADGLRPAQIIRIALGEYFGRHGGSEVESTDADVRAPVTLATQRTAVESKAMAYDTTGRNISAALFCHRKRLQISVASSRSAHADLVFSGG